MTNEIDQTINQEQNRVDDLNGGQIPLPTMEGVPGERLKSFIERVERLETEKQIIAEDIKEVYAEAKTSGFEPKIIRKVVSMRKIELEKRREDGELLDLYMCAIGMEE